jgi:hypothetical protein
VALSLSLDWYYQATKNIQSFGTKKITSPGMAVIWWFVPVYFFLKHTLLLNNYGRPAIQKQF